MDNKEKDIVDKDLTKMDDDIQDVKDFIQRKTGEVVIEEDKEEIKDITEPVEGVVETKDIPDASLKTSEIPVVEADALQEDKVEEVKEEEPKEETISNSEDEDNDKKEEAAYLNLEQDPEPKPLKRVFKKTKHGGRIFLMSLTAPILALGTTAIVWPIVKSCKGQTSDSETTDVKIVVSGDGANITSKKMVGENLEVKLEAKNKEAKEITKVVVKKGTTILVEGTDFVFTINNQTLKILKAGLAKEGELSVTTTVDDKYSIVGNATIESRAPGKDGIVVKIAPNNPSDTLMIKKVTKGGEVLDNKDDYSWSSAKSTLTIFDETIEAYPGAVVITVNVIEDFNVTCEGCNVTKEMGKNAVTCYLEPQDDSQIIASVDKVTKGNTVLRKDKDYRCDLEATYQYIDIYFDVVANYPGDVVIEVTLNARPVTAPLIYTINESTGNCSVQASDSFAAEEASIDASYDGHPVTEIAAYGFNEKTSLKTINIPSSVNKIGAKAFFNVTAGGNANFEKSMMLWKASEAVSAHGCYFPVNDPMAAFSNLALVSTASDSSLERMTDIPGMAIYTSSSVLTQMEKNGNVFSTVTKIDKEFGSNLVIKYHWKTDKEEWDNQMAQRAEYAGDGVIFEGGLLKIANYDESKTYRIIVDVDNEKIHAYEVEDPTVSINTTEAAGTFKDLTVTKKIDKWEIGLSLNDTLKETKEISSLTINMGDHTLTSDEFTFANDIVTIPWSVISSNIDQNIVLNPVVGDKQVVKEIEMTMNYLNNYAWDANYSQDEWINAGEKAQVTLNVLPEKTVQTIIVNNDYEIQPPNDYIDLETLKFYHNGSEISWTINPENYIVIADTEHVISSGTITFTFTAKNTIKALQSYY